MHLYNALHTHTHTQHTFFLEMSHAKEGIDNHKGRPLHIRITGLIIHPCDYYQPANRSLLERANQQNSPLSPHTQNITPTDMYVP